MDKNPQKGLKEYVKYSGIAIQMFVVALAGGYIGSRIDKYFAFSFPFFTLFLLFAAIFAVFYKLYKELS